MGLFDGFGVRLARGVLGQRPIDARHRGVLALALAGGDDQVGLDLLDGLAARATPEHGVEHVVGDDRGSAAVLALACRGVRRWGPVDQRMALSPSSAGHGPLASALRTASQNATVVRGVLREPTWANRLGADLLVRLSHLLICENAEKSNMQPGGARAEHLAGRHVAAKTNLCAQAG